MMGWGDGWYWWGFGALHMLLFWAFFIVLIVVLVRWLGGQGMLGGRTESGRALEVLKERYARGEIGKEEFEQKKRDLS